MSINVMSSVLLPLRLPINHLFVYFGCILNLIKKSSQSLKHVPEAALSLDMWAEPVLQYHTGDWRRGSRGTKWLDKVDYTKHWSDCYSRHSACQDIQCSSLIPDKTVLTLSLTTDGQTSAWKQMEWMLGWSMCRYADVYGEICTWPAGEKLYQSDHLSQYRLHVLGFANLICPNG